MFRLSNIRVFIVLFFTTTLCLADYTGMVITTENEITFSQKNGYDVVQIDNQSGIIDSVGAPQIPFKEFKYLIPYDVEVEDLIINSFNEMEIEGSYYLYPTQPQYPLDYGPDPPFVEPDSVIYGQTEKYPSVKAELITQNTSFGYKIATVRFYPIRYIPVQRKLYRLWSIDFTLTYSSVQISDELPERRSRRSQKIVEAFIKSLVENPDDFGSVTGGPNQIIEENPETGNLELTPFPTLDGDIVDYLIITNNPLTAEFQRLADWKTKKGIPTLVVTVDWITANYPGCDTAEKIRNYLKDVYEKWSTPYVLLGGDVNIVPARFSDYLIYENTEAVTDLYYSNLVKTGDPNYNWNADGDNKFDERYVDGVILGSDNFIGRAPVENLQEAELFVDKILYYEHQSSDYVDNVLLIGAHIHEWNDFTGQGHKNYIDNIYIPANKNVWKLYDDYSDPSANGDEELNLETALDNLSNGSGYGYFHIVNHIDHGGPYSIGAGVKHGGSYMGRGDADNLVNGPYYQILWTYACDPNAFHKDCFSEHYINNPNGGGVAFIGNTSVGYTSQFPQDKEFFKAVYEDLKINLGVCFQKSRDKRERRAR